ncbi:hypothetical protein M427DRAFT_29873 [Gonapodya prolifera JEL478]|uniref:Uncharacterized protein n=1 Tax=Gonapodya prolifera (strain JEL478) TaxID=1344416 RepID=A0A139AN44_GONPJ|nr:hypothetical protein M427DRAFT_29873 [Gonapodya prolifera JEL478]|eukprot:KXS18128.1 hypothetical protein M427DRAFT_29873 [Gonapodya prolifera JEL478]
MAKPETSRRPSMALNKRSSVLSNGNAAQAMPMKHDVESAAGSRIYFNRSEEAIAGVFYVMRGDTTVPTTRKSILLTVASFLVDFLQVLAIVDSACPKSTLPDTVLLSFFGNENIWKLLSRGNFIAFVVVQFVLCALVISVVSVTVYVAWSFKDRVVRWLWPVELLRLFVGVFVGAFLILVLDTLLMPFQCAYIKENFSHEYECVSPLALALMASSLLALVFYVPLALLAAYLFFDYNPKARRSESKAHGRAEVWNTVGRVIISVFKAAQTSSPDRVLLSVVLIVSLVSIINGIVHAPFYRHYLNKLRSGTSSISVALCVLALAGGSLEDPLSFSTFVGCAFGVGWALADARCRLFESAFRRNHAAFASNHTSLPVSAEDIRVSELSVAVAARERREFAVAQLIFETDFYLVFRHAVVSWDDMAAAEKVSTVAYLRSVYQGLDRRNGPSAGWFLFYCAMTEFHLANETERSREFLVRAKACRPPWDVIVAIYSLCRDMRTAKEAAQNDGRPLSITEQMSHKKFFDAATGSHNAIYATAHKLGKVMDLKRTSQSEVSSLTVRLVESVMAAEEAYALLCSEFPDNTLAMRLWARLYEEVFHDKAEALRLEVMANEVERVGSPREFEPKRGVPPGMLSTQASSNASKTSDHPQSSASLGSSGSNVNKTHKGSKQVIEVHLTATTKALWWMYLCLALIASVNIASLVLVSKRISETGDIISLVRNTGNVLKNTVQCNVGWLLMLEDRSSYQDPDMFKRHQAEFDLSLDQLRDSVNLIRDTNQPGIVEFFNSKSVVMPPIPTNSTGIIYYQSQTQFSSLMSTFIQAMRIVNNYSYDFHYDSKVNGGDVVSALLNTTTKFISSLDDLVFGTFVAPARDFDPRKDLLFNPSCLSSEDPCHAGVNDYPRSDLAEEEGSEGHLNVFIAAQFVLCILVLSVVAITVYVAWSFKDRVVRWLWPVELLRLFVGVFVGAFLILVTDTLLMPFQCAYIQDNFSHEYDCASPLALTLMASSALALLFYVPLALLSAYLFFDYNPKAKRSESKAHGRAEVWNTVGRRDFGVDQLIFETDFYLVFRNVIITWDGMAVAEKISTLAYLRSVYQNLDKRSGPAAGWFLFYCAVIEFHLANETERSREFLARAKACHPPWDVIVAIYSLSRDMRTAKEAAQNDGRPLSITEQMSHKKFFDAATSNHNVVYATAHKLSKIVDLKRTSQNEISSLIIRLVSSVLAAEEAMVVVHNATEDLANFSNNLVDTQNVEFLNLKTLFNGMFVVDDDNYAMDQLVNGGDVISALSNVTQTFMSSLEDLVFGTPDHPARDFGPRKDLLFNPSCLLHEDPCHTGIDKYPRSDMAEQGLYLLAREYATANNHMIALYYVSDHIKLRDTTWQFIVNAAQKDLRVGLSNLTDTYIREKDDAMNGVIVVMFQIATNIYKRVLLQDSNT